MWNFVANEELDLTEIVGSSGKVTYANFLNLPIVIERDGRTEKFEIPHPEHVQQPLIQLIVNELLGTERSPSTGKSGAMTSWVMDKIMGRI
jgi:hypothetical protein